MPSAAVARSDSPFWIVNAIVSAVALAVLAYLLLLRGGSEGGGESLAFMPAVNAAFNGLSAVLLTLGVMAIAIGIAAALAFLRRSPPREATRVVVAPLLNRTGDSTLTSIGAMAADWITQGIVDEGVAPTVAPLSAMAASREADSLTRRGPTGSRVRLLAEETGAGLVVAGAYDRVGDSLAFEVHLSDPLTGRVLAALPVIKSGLTDPSSALVELRSRVVGALRVHLSPVAGDPTGQRASRPPTPAAHQAGEYSPPSHAQHGDLRSASRGARVYR